MREHDLQPRLRRRFMATMGSRRKLPIFLNLAKDMVPDGPHRLGVADMTYIAINPGFV
jgi:putative transposase